MKKLIGGLGIVGLFILGVAGPPAVAQVKNTFARVTTTTNQTFTYYTANATKAHVTITADVGSPDGTVTISSRQTASGKLTTLYAVSSPTGTKTYAGESQGELVVAVTNLTTGTIGIEVLTR